MAVSEAVLIEAGVQSGLVDRGQLAILRTQARREHVGLLEFVTRKQRFPVVALYRALATVRGLPFVSAAEIRADLELLRKLPAPLVQRRLFLPVTEKDGGSCLVVSDPDDQVALDVMHRSSDRKFRTALADPDTVRSAMQRAYRKLHTASGGDTGLEDDTGDADAVALFDEVMKEAYLNRASDIHLDPERDGMRVRLRIDGRLREYSRRLSMAERDALMTRVKVLGQLDIAEQRETQDGSLHYRIPNWESEEFDIRLATAPTRWGERATLRLFGDEMVALSLEQLGMPSAMLGGFRDAIRKPHGIILVTGPTGSGKTTTLYAALRELNAEELNILTVEDPVEQIIDGTSQVQVGTKLDFAGALRSFLRHDPDVMLVGEIRDLETADTALRAALTGHLVLSTLHTNDAASALTRLVDIGVERYLIASTVLGVIAQRLVRRLCPYCKDTAEPTDEEAAWLGEEFAAGTISRPVGCPNCMGSGYQGRVGVFEALWSDSDLAGLIDGGANEQVIRDQANLYLPMSGDARSKVADGLTTIDEIRRLNLMGSR